MLGIVDGFWIELETSEQTGVIGGLPPRFYKGDLSSSNEAFVPAIHHQIHCVVSPCILVLSTLRAILSQSVVPRLTLYR